ncbi:MAG: alanine racemase, partial [Bacteroidota bacterium]
MKHTLKKLMTPAVLVDEQVLIRNIKRMQKKATQLGIRMCPHVKAHKSLYIAALQMNYGAEGITAAKVSEALPFIQAGFPALTLAYPLVERTKINRLLRVAKQHQCALTLVRSTKGYAKVSAGKPAWINGQASLTLAAV